MLNNLFFMNMKLVSLCLIIGLVFSFNNSFVQAKEGNLKDIDVKDGETSNVEDLELEKKGMKYGNNLLNLIFLAKLIEN
ncbi:hypothetical protein OEA_27625 (plasmid) [Priestia megaterium NCT-2]|uniref:hypothetical protein n=1 Tax=Priestia megaterium TaxID=1404 RepID=UPI00034DEE88|nr:hypothetical protein [Priestia megaterium]AYE53448.1 hypothetical protein OEA_27625 [Priestia megaterium NCT-2]